MLLGLFQGHLVLLNLFLGPLQVAQKQSHFTFFFFLFLSGDALFLLEQAYILLECLHDGVVRVYVLGTEGGAEGEEGYQ